MRHRSSITKFNRDTKSRKALFKSLVRSLVETGTVVTTTSKAKETKRIADKLIGKAKVDSLATRRTLHRFFGTRDVVNSLVDRIAPEFSDKVSGFTRIKTVGVRRGDNSQMAEVSLVRMPAVVGTLKNTDTKNKEVKKAKKTVAKKVVSTKKVESTKKIMPASKKESVKKTTTAKKASKKESK